MELDKLNRKLLEFAGFKCEREMYIDSTQGPPMLYEAVWSAPPNDSNYTYLPVVAPNFPNSLDACFKWLMKQVGEKLGEKEYIKFLMWWVLHMEEGGEALALCSAIEKLIDGEK